IGLLYRGCASYVYQFHSCIFNAIIISDIYTVSFYGGLAIKEYYLSKELDKVDDSRPPPHERAMRARIVQLEQERQELLKEGQNLDIKIGDIRKLTMPPFDVGRTPSNGPRSIS
ncbi:hypothetical protein I307_03434, partial [Cryptococcus deuterogattii 99/473]